MKMHRLIILSVVFILSFGTAMGAETLFETRQKFTKIENLIKLIERYRDAGFTDEQINQMELSDGKGRINVEEYIRKYRLAEKARQDALKAFLSKKFLTVQDIYSELATMEPENLTHLREELVSE